MNATRVSPAAYHVTSQHSTTQPKHKHRKALGCFLRGLIAAMFVLVAVLLLGAAYAIYTYYSIASTLPAVDDLKEHTSQFETTRIFDRNGRMLYELNDPNAGRRTYVRLEKISPYLVAATLATEDQNFYSHPGFDPTAIIRAFIQNTSEGGIVSGASTITQQLARMLLLSPEERSEQSYMRKVREAMLAAEVTRRYTKDEILELVPQRGVLRQPRLRHRGRRRDVFQHHRRPADLFTGGLPGRAAAVPRHLRHPHKPGGYPQPHAPGAGADVPGQRGGRLHLCQQQPRAGVRHRPRSGGRLAGDRSLQLPAAGLFRHIPALGAVHPRAA